MMNPADLPYALHGLFIVAVVLGWFYSPWQGYVIACSRERLISLRDRWTSLLTSEHVSAEQPAARMIRGLFDAQIQSLPCISLPAVLIARLILGARRRVVSNRFDFLLRDLPDGKVREKARELQEEAVLNVALLIGMRSLVCWIAAVALGPLVVLIAIGLLSRWALRADGVSLQDEILRIRRALLRNLRPLTYAELRIFARDDDDLSRKLSTARLPT